MLSANNMQKYFKIQFLCLHIARYKDVQVLPSVEFDAAFSCLCFDAISSASYKSLCLGNDSPVEYSYPRKRLFLRSLSEQEVSLELDSFLSFLSSALNDVGRSLSSNDEKQLSLLLEAS